MDGDGRKRRGSASPNRLFVIGVIRPIRVIRVQPGHRLSATPGTRYGVGVETRRPAEPTPRQWARLVAAHAGPRRARSLLQLLGNLTAFAMLWAAMAWLADSSYPLALCLAVPAAGFLVRLFIIQHDCGHRSFFASRAGNDWVGRALGVLTLTPYEFWRRTHDLHHGNVGDLGRRGLGAIRTLTVTEYARASPLHRLLYRTYRHPLVLVGLGGVFQFLLRHRIPVHLPAPAARARRSVLATDAAIVALWGTLGWLVGFPRLLAVELPIVALMAWAGVCLFYVQHQFERTYWQAGDSWDAHAAALRGSSFLALPAVLDWFTGHIGLHHVHHLCPRVPNYRLWECLRRHPALADVNRITAAECARSFRLALWDERKARLVSFREALAQRDRASAPSQTRRSISRPQRMNTIGRKKIATSPAPTAPPA